MRRAYEDAISDADFYEIDEDEIEPEGEDEDDDVEEPE